MTVSATMNTLSTEQISAEFLKKYSIEEAFTLKSNPCLSKRMFEFRHQIYCELLNYEACRDSRIESDPQDVTSTFFAITDNKTGNVVACARVINGSPDFRLPVESFCQLPPEENKLHPEHFDRKLELSRFIVDPRLLDRKNDKNSIIVSSQIRFVMINLVLTYACQIGVKDVFILSESKIIRFMAMSGVPIRAIDKLVKFKGLRKPAHIDADTFIHSTNETFKQSRYICSINEALKNTGIKKAS